MREEPGAARDLSALGGYRSPGSPGQSRGGPAILAGMANHLPRSDRAPVTVAVLRAILTGLPFGYYRSLELAKRYDDWAEGQGVPLHARSSTQQLGIALRQAGFGAHRRRGHPALWTIDPARLDEILSRAEGTVSETPSGPLR